jgi:hypothetical protein
MRRSCSAKGRENGETVRSGINSSSQHFFETSHKNYDIRTSKYYGNKLSFCYNSICTSLRFSNF